MSPASSVCSFKFGVWLMFGVQLVLGVVHVCMDQAIGCENWMCALFGDGTGVELSMPGV